MTASNDRIAEKAFRFDEKYLSQIPAPRMLVNPSYRYLTVTEA